MEGCTVTLNATMQGLADVHARTDGWREGATSGVIAYARREEQMPGRWEEERDVHRDRDQYAKNDDNTHPVCSNSCTSSSYLHHMQVTAANASSLDLHANVVGTCGKVKLSEIARECQMAVRNRDDMHEPWSWEVNE